jgi:hypothetical protein
MDFQLPFLFQLKRKNNIHHNSKGMAGLESGARPFTFNWDAPTELTNYFGL